MQIKMPLDIFPLDVFKEKFNKKEIPEPYSYSVEIDYLEWEGLISRLSKYKKMAIKSYFMVSLKDIF